MENLRSGDQSHHKHAVPLSRSGVAVLDGTVASLKGVRHAMGYRNSLPAPSWRRPKGEIRPPPIGKRFWTDAPRR